MPSKVFIEEHLNDYLKSLVRGKSYIPGVIMGQVSKQSPAFLLI